MTPAEERFKNIVRSLHERGIYPGPTAINIELRGHKSNHINGRETKWRREVMEELKLPLLRPNSEWYDPQLSN
jgi:hypothetical protein